MYPTNDYRNYLAHHGILGQKWGVRRYQPYSTTGPRKGGKTGKEIGEAREVKSSKDISRDLKKKYKLTKRETKELRRDIDEDRKIYSVDKNRNISIEEAKRTAKKFGDKYDKFIKDSNAGKYNKMDADEWQDKKYDLKFDSARAYGVYRSVSGDYSHFAKEIKSFRQTPIKNVKRDYKKISVGKKFAGFAVMGTMVAAIPALYVASKKLG